MQKIILPIAILTMVVSCGASIPPPTQRMADAQSAERSARELGASEEPSAQLSLKLAQEQIEKARKAMSDEKNEQADSLLSRAKADAELAIVQARQKEAKLEWQKALENAAAQKSTNASQGAVK
jgi:hypothetical protein